MSGGQYLSKGEREAHLEQMESLSRIETLLIGILDALGGDPDKLLRRRIGDKR